MAKDLISLQGTDFVEFYVGDAKTSAYYHQVAFGFQPAGYSGMETGQTDRVSYMLKQDKVTLIFTGSLTPDSEIAKHVAVHGNGVKYIALKTDDADKCLEVTTANGAKQYLPTETRSDENGDLKISSIHTYGDTVHLFIDRTNYKGDLLPGFEKWETEMKTEPIGFKYIDHMVGNTDWGEMDKWANFYNKTMGFEPLITFDENDISTEYTALKSVVMASSTGLVRYPINEPAKGKKKSQIEEYIQFYGGAGCQHIALATDDILTAVAAMRARGVEFLDIPDTYYEDLVQRVPEVKDQIEEIKRLSILVDRDDKGYLLQIFTKPIEDRPTFFYEIIQREGAESFGKGNFKALFVSIERDQERRGTL